MLSKLFKQKAVSCETQTRHTQTDLESGDENINTLLDIVKEPCIVKEILDIKNSLEILNPSYWTITIKNYDPNGRSRIVTLSVNNYDHIYKAIKKIIDHHNMYIINKNFKDMNNTEKTTFINKLYDNTYISHNGTKISYIVIPKVLYITVIRSHFVDDWLAGEIEW